MIVFIAANYAIGLCLQSNRASFTSRVPIAALVVNFISILVVLYVFPSFANQHLISSARVGEVEGNAEWSCQRSICLFLFDLLLDNFFRLKQRRFNDVFLLVQVNLRIFYRRNKFSLVWWLRIISSIYFE